jgi:hypothetical protein
MRTAGDQVGHGLGGNHGRRSQEPTPEGGARPAVECQSWAAIEQTNISCPLITTPLARMADAAANGLLTGLAGLRRSKTHRTDTLFALADVRGTSSERVCTRRTGPTELNPP